MLSKNDAVVGAIVAFAVMYLVVMMSGNNNKENLAQMPLHTCIQAPYGEGDGCSSSEDEVIETVSRVRHLANDIMQDKANQDSESRGLSRADRRDATRKQRYGRNLIRDRRTQVALVDSQLSNYLYNPKDLAEDNSDGEDDDPSRETLNDRVTRSTAFRVPVRNDPMRAMRHDVAFDDETLNSNRMAMEHETRPVSKHMTRFTGGVNMRGQIQDEPFAY